MVRIAASDLIKNSGINGMPPDRRVVTIWHDPNGTMLGVYPVVRCDAALLGLRDSCRDQIVRNVSADRVTQRDW